RMTSSLDEALAIISESRAKGDAISVGLVGNCADVLPELVRPAADEFGENIGTVADQPHRNRVAFRPRFADDRERLVEAGCHAIAVAGLNAFLDPLRIDIDSQEARPGHGRRERLRSTHSAHPA